MILLLATALAAATPTVTTRPNAPPPPTRTTTPGKAKPAEQANRDPMAEFAAVMKMFDKFFPAGPEPDPKRLALARTTAQGLLPPGAYGRGMGEFMGGFADHIMGMSEADFAEFDKIGGKSKDTKAKPAALSTQTLRQKLVAEDPHFEERMRLTKAAIMTELDKMSVVVEPKLREGLARTVARRFNEKQIAEINAFFATESGRALGSHFLGMWFDPDMMRSFMGTMPELVMAAPGALMRVEAATAHLPKPPKKATADDKSKTD